jgi:hypothetical protein
LRALGTLDNALDFFVKEIEGAKAGGIVFVIDPKADAGISADIAWESGIYKAAAKGTVVETGAMAPRLRRWNERRVQSAIIGANRSKRW